MHTILSATLYFVLGKRSVLRLYRTYVSHVTTIRC